MRTLTDLELEDYHNALRKALNEYPDDTAEHKHNRELIERMAQYALYRRFTDEQPPLTFEQYVSPKPNV